MGVQRVDVGIAGETIAALGVDLSGARVIEAEGRWVMPGGVDPHAHIEQISGMGVMNADTFETAGASALIGGTTTVISFAAQRKGMRLRDALDDYAARAARGARTDHAFHLLIADPDVPDFEADLAALTRAGHRSIKIFTTYNISLGDRAILRVLQLARDLGALVCVHAENDAIIEAARSDLLAADKVAPRDHAASRPAMAEVEAVARLCRFAEHTRARVMLFHISTAEAVEVVARAKARGAPVLAETCPHYLFMTADVLDQPQGAKWMCSPPQRTVADQQALWHGLRSGVLDLVSSDHAPYRHDETGKLRAGADAPFPEIANGMPGLETRLPLMFDAMMSGDTPDPEGFARLTATAAVDIYGLPRKGRIATGCDADLVIWDPGRHVTYGANDLHDNVGYNPWEGRMVIGWPETVMLRGQVVVENGACLASPGSGRWLARQIEGEGL
jgi:dihydropyrimidinase